ncbi:S8 family serine peptidase [Janibacter sp. UYMM211]|uniref:S8 family serine peptidase n=1 Tax=Janibacter sp. UYMM211 TaxID=3156342 RepID=UPI00339AB5CE
MRHTKLMALVGATALGVTGLASATTATAAAPAAPVSAPAVAAQPSGPSMTSGAYVVLADKGADIDSVVRRVKAAGGTVTSINRQIGMITVDSSNRSFASKARGLAGVKQAAAEISVGRSPKSVVTKDQVLREHQRSAAATKSTQRSVAGSKSAAATKGDPLDSKLWGLEMVDSFKARAVNPGNRLVRVGVIDTGVQANHPDIAGNFSTALSKNFTRDIPAIDGDCEYDGCVDPATVDHGGHGTHVAGTIAAKANGFGVSGVAPNVVLANVRAGQDSGYFFLGPVANAITWAADKRMDVVNMSFYVDPWAFNCRGGAPEDSPEQAAQQDVTIETMERVLDYAHRRDVTMVAALGNGHDDLSNPRNDLESPNFPEGVSHERTIDNATCFDLPTEGANVIGTSAVGPSGTKADYSNWATDLSSGEIEVSAPGGWFRDGFGTDTFRTNENLILSTASQRYLQEQGLVSKWGYITQDGKDAGVIKQCSTTPVSKGANKCGYYEYLQGTSMAAPHASGVAALIVSARGSGKGMWFGHDSRDVAYVLKKSAADHACPEGGVQEYTNEGRDAEFTATCVSKPGFNGFYGDGIVNAYNAVTFNR